MKADFEKILIAAFFRGKGRISPGHEIYALAMSQREAKEVADSLERQGLFRTDEIELDAENSDVQQR